METIGLQKDLKIIYIMGDGRTGSTLLESILANSKNSIGIGESYRFWERFYKADSLCGCNKYIQDCELWRFVDTYLQKHIENYDVKRIRQYIKYYSNYNNSIQLVTSKLWSSELEYLVNVIAGFYRAIQLYSGKDIIIDSSKSPVWVFLISKCSSIKLFNIHLERDLPSVASSWKKKYLLKEYPDRQHFMPIKSDLNIIRTSLRIKILSHHVKKNTKSLKIRYKDLCLEPTIVINEVKALTNLNLPTELKWEKNHAIAGNPGRKIGGEIMIMLQENKNNDLNFLQVAYFKLINKISNSVFK